LGGIVEVIYEMTLERGMVSPRSGFAGVLRNSSIMAVSLIVVMYIIIRTLNYVR
jgi:hypothetical protein